MAGGIIFTAPGIRLRDQFGGQVVCTACGGESWDVTLGGPAGERIRCAAISCDQPADAEALAVSAEVGQIVASAIPPLDLGSLIGWLRNEMAANREIAGEFIRADDHDAAAVHSAVAAAYAQVVHRITLG